MPLCNNEMHAPYMLSIRTVSNSDALCRTHGPLTALNGPYSAAVFDMMRLSVVQVPGLCGPQFLSYLPKCFTHLCRAWRGDAILVYRFGVQFFYIKALFFSLEN